MSQITDRIEKLKLNLKSATKLKLIRERDLFIVRTKEKSLSEELAVVKVESEFLKEQLQEIKCKIVEIKQQISVIGICSYSEKLQVDSHIRSLQDHSQGYQKIFDKERELYDLRMKEIKDKETEEEELLRQKEKELGEKRDKENIETIKVKAECEALERQCVILKKKNNAIMLKLKRQLLETENGRRALAQKCAKTVENISNKTQ